MKRKRLHFTVEVTINDPAPNDGGPFDYAASSVVRRSVSIIRGSLAYLASSFPGSIFVDENAVTFIDIEDAS